MILINETDRRTNPDRRQAARAIAFKGALINVAMFILGLICASRFFD